MQPKEIISSLPRQKVRRISRPEVIAEVLRHDVMHPEWVHVHEIDYPGAEVVSWSIKDCEPVPNQRIALRIGDRVSFRKYGQEDVQTYGTIEAIQLTEGEERMRQYRVAGEWIYGDELSAATPEEDEDYFRK